MDKKYLIDCIESGMTTREIAAEAGKGQSTVMYWLKKHDLVTSGKGTKAKRCSCGKEISFYAKTCLGCHHEKRRNIEDKLFSRWADGDNSVLSSHEKRSGSLSVGRKKRFFSATGNACERCGWAGYADGYDYPALEVSHRDNDFKNMSYENLEALCPNCHTLKTLNEPVQAGNGRRLNYENAPVA